jgi:hypothetical protein
MVGRGRKTGWHIETTGRFGRKAAEDNRSPGRCRAVPRPRSNLSVNHGPNSNRARIFGFSGNFSRHACMGLLNLFMFN